MARDEARVDLSGVHVAILGWAGSTPRQLRAVGGFYRRNGAAGVLSHTADVLRAMSRPEGFAPEGARLARRVAAMEAERLVVHLFSNAGFWTHAAALAAGAQYHRRVRAVIMDSAPGFPERIDPGFYAQYSTMAMMPVVLARLRRPPAVRHPLLTPPIWAFMRLWYHLSPRQRGAAEASLSVVEETGRWDHLLLYSAADELVPPHFVEAFAHRLRERGRAVRTRRWEDGGHVRQMIVHRPAYLAEVASFLATRVT